MPFVIPRRSFLKGLAAAPLGLGAPAYLRRAWAANTPGYPAPLSAAGYTQWRCAFNPDLTQPAAQVIGRDAVATPLSYNCPPSPSSGNTKLAYATSANGLTVTIPAAVAGAQPGTAFSTMDGMFRGNAWGAPVYVEAQYVASLPPNDKNYNTCFWMTSSQAWNVAQGGNYFGGNGVGQTTYNRCEIDLIEVNPYDNLFRRGPQRPIYASTTYHWDTGDSGPIGADVDITYQQFSPAVELFNRPVHVAVLWLDGSLGLPNTCTTWWNGAQVLTGKTPACWSDPAPFGPPTMWVTGGTWPHSSHVTMTYTLNFLRVWTP